MLLPNHGTGLTVFLDALVRRNAVAVVQKRESVTVVCMPSGLSNGVRAAC